MSPVTCHVSHVTCHMSHVMCHMSHVRCHISCVTHHIFFLSFLTKWWSVSVKGLLSMGPTPFSYLSVQSQYLYICPISLSLYLANTTIYTSIYIKSHLQDTPLLKFQSHNNKTVTHYFHNTKKLTHQFPNTQTQSN